jgi:hypothetical protein
MTLLLNKNIEKVRTHLEMPSPPSPPSPFTLQICYDSSTTIKEIDNGLDLILSHFNQQDPFLFPRKISTYKSNNKQFLVRSKQEIIDAFKQSNFLDCRINGYPYLIDYKGIQRHKPNFLFIDLDRNNFKTDRSLKLALSNTLRNINEKLVDDSNNAQPTVLFTGGGYHIYQPVYIPTALEYITEFSKFDRPSEQFLRFAKDFLSNKKADKQNNPSFRSCLLRIPGSINSKYNTKVKIIQKWNGIRAPIILDLLEEFRIYSIQKKIDQIVQRQKIWKERRNKKNINVNANEEYFAWIERLLRTPILDFRKLVIDLVLSPYLINVRKLPYEESYKIIKEWLDKCNNIKKLDNYRNFEYRINYALTNSYKNKYHL